MGQDPSAMQIQEEPPRVAHPLATLDEDYEQAVLHLAWDRHTKTSERTLLFAFVELLPVEVPPPLDEGKQERRLSGKSEHWVYVRRVVVPARRALEWYLSCRRGIAVLPDDAGHLPEAADPSATKLALADLGEEPPWPTLACVSGESDTVPFCPAWHAQPRAHHLIPLAALDLERLWAEERERTTAVQWIAERFHFSLEDYPEYWGSVHLVAPNSVYRSLEERVHSRTPPQESVLVRFQPRTGKPVEGLELTFTEKTSWGPLDLRHMIVKSPILKLNFERMVETTKVDVFDPKRGVIAASLEGFFPRRFKASLGFVIHSVKVRGSTPRASYEVNRTGKPQTMMVDDGTSAPPARSRMMEAHSARRMRGEARRQDQRWFSGQQQEAADVLRSLINSAQRDVLLVDPYFGPDELYSFPLAVEREDVPIRILTSAEGLRPQRDQKGNTITPVPSDALLAALNRITKMNRMNPIDIHVMIGGRPAIHDRFLLIDDRIWLLGSSLNEFGSRGTMMVALPDPAQVREHLLKAWSNARELQAWVKARRKSSGGTTGGKT